VLDLSFQSCKTVIPSLLKVLIQQFVKGELKQVKLAKAVMQAAQTRTNILPLQFGVGVKADHMFGSEDLLQIMSHLGFCISYDEVV